MRPRIQAAFEKQKDNHNKRISHLTKKVENYRAKLKSKSIRKSNLSPSRPVTEAAQPLDISTILENRKLVSNRSSTSNLGEELQVENHEDDSAKSSKRASIADDNKLESATGSNSVVTHDLDAFVEVLWSYIKKSIQIFSPPSVKVP